MISLLLNRYTNRDLCILRNVFDNALAELAQKKCAIGGITCDKCSNRRVCADLSNAIHFIDVTIAEREK